MLSSTLLTLLALTSATPLARSTTLTAQNLLTIAPSTSTCDPTADFATECRPATVAAPAIAKSFTTYTITTFGAQAALVSIILFESGNFKYSQNHFPAPGNPGQGTRNMQSPAFNAKYADDLAAKGVCGLTTEKVAAAKAQGPEKVLELVNTDSLGFASAAWFLRTQCGEGVEEGLAGATEEGYVAYLTECVGTTATEERIAGWKAVVALGQW
ncbi:hypothetical protein M409DRAFT_30423 [Zasmidium cellare ATCC 36951]|uniref:Uncharacterized protein n=1 Tax=Zasmidium cellare ATCC 36951 TaxID=1080233 RepID=A0A6A6BYZ8_ZASCE|nr:uncharacterized protein M409DRAFT_30423 [Zasmidium cellare ATCC 36951]KAF2159140.1 hypothetical protein M409DRAFT_30423 [Zasmidium cellare ATCC 36951]